MMSVMRAAGAARAAASCSAKAPARRVQARAGEANWIPGSEKPAYLEGLAGNYGADPFKLGEDPANLAWYVQRARVRAPPHPRRRPPKSVREGGPPRRRSPRRAGARGERATPLRRGGKEATPGAGRTEESWRLARAAAPRPQPATRRPPRWAKPRSGETSARAFPQPLCAPRAWWEGLSLERVWWRG